MARYNHIINSFINGEVSPKLSGRTDTDAYRRSCRKLLNMIVHPQGGVSRRVGTQYLLDKLPTTSQDGENIDLGEGTRVIPWVVSPTEIYLVIFAQQGEYYGTLFSRYVCHIYNPIDDHILTVELGTQSAWDTLYGNGGTLNDLTDADVLKEMQVATMGDLMFIAHDSFPPIVIARWGKNYFTSGHFYTRPNGLIRGFESGGSGSGRARAWAYAPLNITDITMEISDVTEGVDRILTASDEYFTPDMKGSPMAFQDSGSVGYVLLKSYLSATQFEVNVVKDLPSAFADGSVQWYEAAWSKQRGYPRAVAIWNGALYFMGTRAEPLKIWRSQVGDFFEFANDETLNPAGTPAADDPFSANIAASNFAEITWAVGTKSSLLVGSRAREYAISAFSRSEVSTNPQTAMGSEYVQPVVVDDVPIYVQRGYRKLREMVYSERDGGYLSPEVTFMAEHMPRLSMSRMSDPAPSKIKYLAYQALDNNLIWVVDNNGYLYACTKSRLNEVTAFHRQELGGEFEGGLPKVLSIASLPSRDGTFDELYLVVKRTVDSSTRITLEKLGNEFYEASLKVEADSRDRQPVFLDCVKIFRTHEPAKFFASLQEGPDADVSEGVGTADVTGNVTYDYQGAKFDWEAGSYITYEAEDNADFSQQGCIRWEWFPLDPGSPQRQETMVCISSEENQEDNQILVYRDTFTAGVDAVVLEVKDSFGSTQISETIPLLEGQSHFSSTKYVDSRAWFRFELNYNFDLGETRLFLNGKQIGPTWNTTLSRELGGIGLLRIGADANGDLVSRSKIRNVAIFDTVQHTEDYEWYEYQPRSTTIKNLSYLEGQSVRVVGDGHDVGSFTVADGEIQLPEEFDTVIVGLPYGHVLDTQILEAGGNYGSSQGEISRVDQLTIRFRDTAAAKYGPTEDDLHEIVFRDQDTPLTDPIKLFTGDKRVDFHGEYDREARLVISGDAPLPCNVTCIVARGMAND